MLTETPLPRVLHRPNLLLGGERRLSVLLIMLAALFVLLGQTIPSMLFGSTLYICGVIVLRWMASADEQMSAVYLRHIRYRDHYQPRSTPWRAL